MKKKNQISTFAFFLGFILCFVSYGFSQQGFTFPNNTEKDKISFELVNNLVVIPVEFNGEKLSFLLDTGVNATVIFGNTAIDSISLNNTSSIKIRGLGTGDGVEALISRNNTMQIGKAKDSNHTAYVIFDESLNLSPRMGVPIHGIIGYDFFKSFVVKTNYNSRKLTFYDPLTYSYKVCRKCESFDLVFSKNKPYVTFKVEQEGELVESILLIDSGSSDALWLFDQKNSISESPKNYFEDFLGLGLSGNIFGKRSKLKQVKVGSFNLNNVNVAFPDEEALLNIRFFDGRDGSVGGDVLKRFTVLMDYPSKKMILKKNNFFYDPFHYNMSGLTIEHSGMSLQKGIDNSIRKSANSEIHSENSAQVTIQVSPVFKFFLAPRFVVAEVRKNSPADLAGVQIGDEILTINGASTYKYELYEIISLFTSKVGKKIMLQIDRQGSIINTSFVLKEVL